MLYIYRVTKQTVQDMDHISDQSSLYIEWHLYDESYAINFVD